MIKIRDLENLPPDTTIWDEGKGAVAGFGARRQKSAAIYFFLRFRTKEGRSRCPTIGRWGQPWTPDTARAEAKQIIGQVAAGRDPAGEKAHAKTAATVADLCDLYLEAAAEGRILNRGKAKKPSTLATDRGRVERHIKPLLGRHKVAAVTETDIEDFRDAVTAGKTAGRFKTGPRGVARVTGGKGTAKRTLALLGVIFSFAVRRRMRPDNPVHGVETHRYAQRQRRLSAEEYGRLGRALGGAVDIWPAALAAIRFLAVSGWRRGEVLNLRWSEVDICTRTATLADTKTGESMRPLAAEAVAILQQQPRAGALVFPALADPGKPMANFNKTWVKLRTRAELPPEITPHVIRHSFASEAGDLRYSDLTIAALLGHAKGSITSRYVHAADAVLLAAVDAVASRVIAKMAGEP